MVLSCYYALFFLSRYLFIYGINTVAGKNKVWLYTTRQNPRNGFSVFPFWKVFLGYLRFLTWNLGIKGPPAQQHYQLTVSYTFTLLAYKKIWIKVIMLNDRVRLVSGDVYYVHMMKYNCTPQTITIMYCHINITKWPMYRMRKVIYGNFNIKG